jgi:hypothetical protein
VESATAQLSFADIVGGDTPSVHRLTVQGVKLEPSETYKKGQLVKIEVTARVGAVLFEDKRDSASDEVVDTIETAKCRFVSGRVIGLDLE